MNPPHAAIATRLVSQLPPGVFAHAVQAAVIHRDFKLVQGMFHDAKFECRAIDRDEWELTATFVDGSKCFWRAG